MKNILVQAISASKSSAKMKNSLPARIWAYIGPAQTLEEYKTFFQKEPLRFFLTEECFSSLQMKFR
jgi:hypothetical protein